MIRLNENLMGFASKLSKNNCREDFERPVENELALTV
jgi:hypothetical protein